MTKFLSLEPFVPSGADFEKAKLFFQELGFIINWDSGDYVGFQKEACQFILQNYENRIFAENLMISVRITEVDQFYKELISKGLEERFGVKIGKPTVQPYGKEVNIIDMAGVCWHFIG